MSVAPWFQEEVRRELEKQFGAEQVHEAGLKVETTLDLDLQQTANHAVRRPGRLRTPPRLERQARKRHRPRAATSTTYKHPDWAMKLHPGDYVHAMVTSVLPLEIRARVGKDQSF
jgi:penicillin-binding protein 1A